jgi:hypothetical protein
MSIKAVHRLMILLLIASFLYGCAHPKKKQDDDKSTVGYTIIYGIKKAGRS